jgi:hypothetical protein
MRKCTIIWADQCCSPHYRFLIDCARRIIQQTVYNSQIVSSWISRFESWQFLFVEDTKRQRVWEQSTFFARTESHYLKRSCCYFYKRSPFCIEKHFQVWSLRTSRKLTSSGCFLKCGKLKCRENETVNSCQMQASYEMRLWSSCGIQGHNKIYFLYETGCTYY